MNPANMLPLVTQYVEWAKESIQQDDALRKVFISIESDNFISSLVSDKTNALISKLMIDKIGKYNFDELEWWMYETEFGAKMNKIYNDDDGTFLEIISVESLLLNRFVANKKDSHD